MMTLTFLYLSIRRQPFQAGAELKTFYFLCIILFTDTGYYLHIHDRGYLQIHRRDATSSTPSLRSIKIVHWHFNIQGWDVPNLTSTSPLLHQIQKNYLSAWLTPLKCWLAMPLGPGILSWVLACRTIEKKRKSSCTSFFFKWRQ